MAHKALSGARPGRSLAKSCHAILVFGIWKVSSLFLEFSFLEVSSLFLELIFLESFLDIWKVPTIFLGYRILKVSYLFLEFFFGKFSCRFLMFRKFPIFLYSV